MVDAVSNKVHWDAVAFSAVVVALRIFRPDWWLVPWAVGVVIAVMGAIRPRRLGKSWIASVLRGLAFGTGLGVLVYLMGLLP